jgi:hypothetical protein
MRIPRRALLAAAAMLGCADAAERPSLLHVTPEGGGDGTSWTAAARLRELDRLIREVEPGGDILIAADRGEYDLREGGIDIAAAGLADRPVRIRGVDSATGAPLAAVLRGNRTAEDTGDDAFRLQRGANHLHFSHFDFQNFGNGCFRAGAPVTGLTIEDCAFDNVYRFLENTAFEEDGHASLIDFVVRRCRGVGAERGFLRVRYASRGGIIEDCAARGAANEGGAIPVGCALDDRASDIVFRRCVMESFQQWRAGSYWNGDGFSDEPGNQGVRYEACEARGSTDGGFDCKSRDVALVNCVAEDNKRNFRIWSERATLTGCTSRAPNFRGEAEEDASKCHIWIGGSGRARIQIADLTIEDGAATPILEFEHEGARVEINGVVIRSPAADWGEGTDLSGSDPIVATAASARAP